MKIGIGSMSVEDKRQDKSLLHVLWLVRRLVVYATIMYLHSLRRVWRLYRDGRKEDGIGIIRFLYGLYRLRRYSRRLVYQITISSDEDGNLYEQMHASVVDLKNRRAADGVN